MLKIVAAFHDKKVEGIIELPAAIAANPTLSITGMQNVQDKLLPKIQELGPFHAMFCSRMARALDTASVLAMAMDLDFDTIKGLGQAGNLDKNSEGVPTVVAYPGHEDDNALTWQSDAIEALQEIDEMMDGVGTILIVSHRPVIGALVAYAQGITDITGIDAIVNSGDLVGNGYRTFQFEENELELIQ